MIEKSVANFELSKRISERGVNRESLFYWREGLKKNIVILKKYSSEFIKRDANIQAYTASELLEMLPSICKIDFTECGLEIYKSIHGGYAIYYTNEGNVYADICEDNICDAIAKMLLCLIENGIVKVEDINK